MPSVTLIFTIEQGNAVVVFRQRQRHAVYFSGQLNQLAELQPSSPSAPKMPSPTLRHMAEGGDLRLYIQMNLPFSRITSVDSLFAIDFTYPLLRSHQLHGIDELILYVVFVNTAADGDL